MTNRLEEQRRAGSTLAENDLRLYEADLVSSAEKAMPHPTTSGYFCQTGEKDALMILLPCFWMLISYYGCVVSLGLF